LNANPQDRSNGYDQVAEVFIRARNPQIGVATVLRWSKTLPPAASILDLGCGHGVPISEALIAQGFQVFGLDASAKLIAAFRERFPKAWAECAAAEESEFFYRKFDAVIAWGLLFLLQADVQEIVIGKVARALNPAGKFLFTSPRQCVTWSDSLTGRTSASLGLEAYEHILRANGLTLDGTDIDEGENHYFFASRRSAANLNLND
jgi:2-polyprenyl-3-methyl-5-hydroxy-6-metoxy-1,4-benzoquinol methylase